MHQGEPLTARHDGGLVHGVHALRDMQGSGLTSKHQGKPLTVRHDGGLVHGVRALGQHGNERVAVLVNQYSNLFFRV